MQSIFTTEERITMKEIFKLGQTTAENLTERLHPDIYNHLRGTNNLNTIIDRIIIRDHNPDKPYDAAVITKFLVPSFDVGKAIQQLVESISNRFLIYIDFHFLMLAPPKSKDPEDDDEFNFQTASKASSVNATNKISSQEDCDDLVSEFKDQSDAELLNTVFQHHVDLFEYHGSGLRPYMLLSTVVHIQKFP